MSMKISIMIPIMSPLVDPADKSFLSPSSGVVASGSNKKIFDIKIFRWRFGHIFPWQVFFPITPRVKGQPGYT